MLASWERPCHEDREEQSPRYPDSPPSPPQLLRVGCSVIIKDMESRPPPIFTKFNFQGLKF